MIWDALYDEDCKTVISQLARYMAHNISSSIPWKSILEEKAYASLKIRYFYKFNSFSNI